MNGRSDASALAGPTLAHDIRRAKASREWMTPAARARRLASRRIVRLKTGVASFDDAARGGLPLGRRVVVAGQPGAGKTTWVVSLAIKWASEAHKVAILAADEEADGLLIRAGQVLGCNRDDLESDDETIRTAALEYVAGQLEEKFPDLHLIDAEEEEATVDGVSERLAEIAPDGAVLIIDSVQTVSAIGAADAEGPRMRVDAVLSAFKKAASRNQLVIATSEVSRGAYRSKRSEDAINLLAAAKESGGIEYQTHALLVMRAVEGETGVVDVDVPKIRFGTKTPFRLRQDFARATFSEVERPAIEPRAVSVEKSEDEKLEGYAKQIRKLILKHDDLCSSNAIDDLIPGARGPKLRALNLMIERGEITQDGPQTKRGKKSFRLAPATPAHTEPRDDDE